MSSLWWTNGCLLDFRLPLGWFPFLNHKIKGMFYQFLLPLIVFDFRLPPLCVFFLYILKIDSKFALVVGWICILSECRINLVDWWVWFVEFGSDPSLTNEAFWDLCLPDILGRADMVCPTIWAELTSYVRSFIPNIHVAQNLIDIGYEIRKNNENLFRNLLLLLVEIVYWVSVVLIWWIDG